MIRHFVNLTNGIELLPAVPEGEPHCFVRIQSTSLEQKRLADVIRACEGQLLLSLAHGEDCLLYDCGCRQDGIPRTIWQGIPWILYATTSAWCGRSNQPTVRGMDVAGYFAKQYHELPEREIGMLRYFKKYWRGAAPRLTGVAARARYDGQYNVYADVVRRFENVQTMPEAH